MNKIALTLISLLILTSCQTNKIEIFLKDGLVIENAKIISPENQFSPNESYIVINEDKIVFIGTNRPSLKGTFKTIDAKGKYLIPGLIDSHVHATSTGALTDKEEIENPEIVNDFRNQIPKSYLYFGYTLFDNPI